MGPTERQDFGRKVSLSKYESVLSVAVDTSRILTKNPPSQGPAKYHFIHEEAKKLSTAFPGAVAATKDESIITEIFSLLGQSWPDLIRGNGHFDISSQWERFMTEFPLGDYASMAAEILRKENFLQGETLEIGAGVGNTSRLVADHLDRNNYLRTDRNIKLLKEHPFSDKIALYDFNREGRWADLSCIFGVNALHCATDKTQTLRHLYEMLAPAGVLLIGEGSPNPLPGVPWALTYLCGFFDGWWDQGGFLPREKWFEHFTEAGFRNIQFAKMSAGENDLGGVIWARK